MSGLFHLSQVRLGGKLMDVVPTTLTHGNFSDVETDVNKNEWTLVEELQVASADEAYVLGQGTDSTQDNAIGRIRVQFAKSDGTKLSDDAKIQIVELSASGNVKRRIFQATHGQLKEGTRTDRLPFAERRPGIGSDRNIGVRVQTDSDGDFTIDTGNASSIMKMDAIKLEA